MGFVNRSCVGFFFAPPMPSERRRAPAPVSTAASIVPVADQRDGPALPVMETFPTVQGEGLYAGQAAYFIRLGGCDVGCHWCDVKESWDPAAHPRLGLGAIVAGASAHPARIAVVTGGEPLMHDLGPLTSALRAAGFRTHLETSGTHPPSGEWHHICFSPKKFKEPLPVFHGLADELKVVVLNKHDLRWADEHAARVGPACALYLQPEWDKRDLVMPLIVERVMADPRWRISLQTHKYLDIP